MEKQEKWSWKPFAARAHMKAVLKSWAGPGRAEQAGCAGSQNKRSASRGREARQRTSESVWERLLGHYGGGYIALKKWELASDPFPSTKSCGRFKEAGWL